MHIKSTNIETDEVTYFPSKKRAGEYHNCSPAMVYIICENLSKTKMLKHIIKFEYSEDKPDGCNFINPPDARIGKIRVSDEDKKKRKRETARKNYIKKKEQDQFLPDTD